ncbi:MAG: hypothetical protein JWM33_2945 [Caulobacteraceae bacterium]|nr:hypothetical protein [Caulobacteraceae bacterium]
MRILAPACMLMALMAGRCLAAEPADYAQLSNAALVEALAGLDNQQPGQELTAIWAEFDASQAAILAECPPKAPTAIELAGWTRNHQPGAVVYSPRPGVTSSPLAGEIIRRGAPILPDLLAHLTDPRQTRYLLSSADSALTGGRQGAWQTGAMFAMVTDCFDPRRGKPPGDCLSGNFDAVPPTRYAAVGDLAFFLAGQIVNRDYYLSGYVPSGGVSFNSPLLTPDLASRARRDWSGFKTQAALRKQLLADGRSTTGGEARRRGAWLRFRYYFPSDYAALTAADARARDAVVGRICAERAPDFPKDPTG